MRLARLLSVLLAILAAAKGLKQFKDSALLERRLLNPA